MAVALAQPGASPVAAQDLERGSSPQSAIDFGTRSGTMVGVLEPGQVIWYQSRTASPTSRNSATLQINPWLDPRFRTSNQLLEGNDPGTEGRIVAYVNVQGTGKDKMGKKNADAPGYTRVGFLNVTKNTGPDRVFHRVRPDDFQTFYYKVVNNWNEPVTYAFSIDHSFCLVCNTGGAENPKDWGALPPPWAFAD